MAAGGNMDTLIFLLIVVAGLVVAIVMVVRGRRGKANMPQPTWVPPPPAFAPQAYQPAGPPGGYAKRCPTCGSVYADETLAYCLSDGSPLELVPASAAQYIPGQSYPPTTSRGNVAPTVQYRPTTDPNRK